MDRFGSRLRDARLALGLWRTVAADGIVSADEFERIESARTLTCDPIAMALAVRMGFPFKSTTVIADTDHARAIRIEAALRHGDWQRTNEMLAELSPAAPNFTYYSAIALERQGEFLGALRLLRDALATCAPKSLLHFRATAAKCRCFRYAGELQASIDVAERALQEFDANADEELVAELRATLAGTYCETGDLIRALDLTEPRTHAIGMGLWATATQRWARSMVLERSGRLAEAATAAFEALQILRDLDQPRTVARMQNNAAWLAMQSDTFDMPLVDGMLREAERTLRDVHASIDLAFVLTTRAELAARCHARETAISCATAAMALAVGQDVGFRARITAAAAHTFASIGEVDRSLALLLTARELLESSGARRSAAATWQEMATTYESLGQTDLQVACLRAAMDLLDL